MKTEEQEEESDWAPEVMQQDIKTEIYQTDEEEDDLKCDEKLVIDQIVSNANWFEEDSLMEKKY